MQTDLIGREMWVRWAVAGAVSIGVIRAVAIDNEGNWKLLVQRHDGTLTDWSASDALLERP